MTKTVSIKCEELNCYQTKKMTPAERRNLREVGEEHNAHAGLICPKHVKLILNENDESIGLDISLEEYLVEVLKEKPEWRVILTRETNQNGWDHKDMPVQV